MSKGRVVRGVRESEAYGRRATLAQGTLQSPLYRRRESVVRAKAGTLGPMRWWSVTFLHRREHGSASSLRGTGTSARRADPRIDGLARPGRDGVIRQ